MALWTGSIEAFPPTDAEKGSFQVHAATTGVAAWSDREGEEKNTARQSLQLRSYL